jgi:hypothetical protein
MSLKQSSINSAKEHLTECWHRERDRQCLRIELNSEEAYLFPYQQFLGAHHSHERESETLIISFSTHEVTVLGRQLDEIASALQNLSIDWIKTIPSRYRELSRDDGAWVTQIDIKTVE